MQRSAGTFERHSGIAAILRILGRNVRRLEPERSWHHLSSGAGRAQVDGRQMGFCPELATTKEDGLFSL